ncbi:MAG: T9SS type A sorting domain-containing protein [Bacteroidales bacterium]|nr:T9SS type A sorting domain-containing protein [Bacteroidales bacterium]
MKKTFILTIFWALGQIAIAQSNLNVLFIGNSYTDVNNLPSLIQQMGYSTGDTMRYQSNTPGGCTFMQHCTNTSMTLICQGGWDFVVLQEQSQYPSFPDSQIQRECLPYAKRLVDSIYANNPCAEPLFYMTWGRKYGDTLNSPYFPPLGTYNGMDSLLALRYMIMKEDNDASVSPVGKVWHYIRDSFPSIELYQADESHPSMAGSYAAACSFYAVLFGKDPTNVTYTSTLDAATASTIRQVAKIVVFDSLSKWLRPLPDADFSYADNNAGVAFTNNSQKADSYLWDFADGTTDTATNPTHAFPAQGTYNVKLIAFRHCVPDTVVKAITVHSGVGLSETVGNSIELFPNPTANYLRISGLENVKSVEIYSADGKKVFEKTSPSVIEVIDTKSFASGIYAVGIITNDGSILRKKLIKK